MMTNQQQDKQDQLLRPIINETVDILLKAWGGGIAAQKEIENQEIKKLKEQLAEYERRGGIVNLERSWKTKYRQAWEEANQHIVELGGVPIRIRKEEQYPKQIGWGFAEKFRPDGGEQG